MGGGGLIVPISDVLRRVGAAGVKIKSIQHGVHRIEAGTTTTIRDITISAVDVDKSIVLAFEVADVGTTKGARAYLASVTLTSAINLRLQRELNDSLDSRQYAWWVIEFDGNVSIQTDEVTMTTTTSLDVTISEVGPKALVVCTNRSTSDSTGVHLQRVVAQLLNSTTIRFLAGSTDGNRIVRYYVVEAA